MPFFNHEADVDHTNFDPSKAAVPTLMFMEGQPSPSVYGN
jgi:hypothetical protein